MQPYAYSIRKLRPIESVQYAPIPVPPVYDIPELTEQEACQSKQKFIGIIIKNELDAQKKILRRARPRTPRTLREQQLAFYKLSKNEGNTL